MNHLFLFLFIKGELNTAVNRFALKNSDEIFEEMNNLQKMDKISVIKSFKYHKPNLHPKLDLGKVVDKKYDNNMKELVSLAKMLNGDRYTSLIRL